MSNLENWLARQGRGGWEKLLKASGVGRATLWRAKRGVPVSFRTASRISAATDGAVGVLDLCEPHHAESPTSVEAA